MKNNYWSCIREKKIHCGKDYLEIDIIPKPHYDTRGKGKRSKKVSESIPKQKNLNDKNSKRYLLQVVHGNFHQGDLHITLTYKNQPSSIEDAEKEVSKFLRRVAYKRKKLGLESLKYVLVTECNKRVHHHIIMNAGLGRDMIENLWSVKGEKLGYVNADRLQFSSNGLEALCSYITKDSKRGKKRWSSSRNLIRPWSRANDYKYTRRKVLKLVLNPDIKQEIEKMYKEYDITEVKKEYNDVTGWSIYIKAWKKE